MCSIDGLGFDTGIEVSHQNIDFSIVEDLLGLSVLLIFPAIVITEVRRDIDVRTQVGAGNIEFSFEWCIDCCVNDTATEEEVVQLKRRGLSDGIAR